MPVDRPVPRPRLTVRPFKGWRFTDGLAQTYSASLDAGGNAVVAPLPRMMRAVLAVDESDAAASAAGRERVRRQLRGWRTDGVLVQDRVPGYYLYRRTDSHRVVVGLIATISLHPPRHRVVVPHEDVDQVMVGRQASLMTAFDGQPEPVVTVHRGSDAFRSVIAAALGTPPHLHEHTGQVSHELWAIQDPEPVARIGTELSGTTLLLADGHHRYAAFRQVQRAHSAGTDSAPWDLGLSMLIDDGDTGLSLGPIHRVLPAVPAQLIRATPGVRVREGREGVCVISMGAKWWTLDPEPIASRPLADPWPELVVSLLHREWLPAWGIEDSAVAYVHDASEAVEQARATGGMALLVPPPTLDAVFDAAASGNLMPAKATSFQPKPLIGLVMRHWPHGVGDL